jgi:hypothetical protein
MDMIRQGHLQQPNVDKPHQLCFMGGSTFFAQTWRSGKGGSCSVYMVKLADGSEVRCRLPWHVAVHHHCGNSGPLARAPSPTPSCTLRSMLACPTMQR